MLPLLLILACGAPVDEGRGGAAPTDGESADTGTDEVDTGAPFDPRYDELVGVETLEFGQWTDAAEDRDCVLHWDVVGTAAPPCDECSFAFDVTLTLDEAASFDDGTCAELWTDLSYTYGYAEDFDGKGPSLVLIDPRATVWWAEAEHTDDTLSWRFGVEEFQDTEYDDKRPEQYEKWLTNLVVGEATLR